MSQQRVLVAGGAGFLGSHVCAAYLEQGWEVMCVDNLTTGSVHNVLPLISELDFHLIAHDVRNALDIPCDLVFNLASPASPPRYQLDPVDTMLTNVVGTANLLDLATKHKARFVQASTSEVYGDPTEHPQTESYRGNVNTLGPRACYDEGKRAAEALCGDYRRMYGTEVRIARIFNTYGPNMAADDGRVVSNFIVAALRGEALRVYGDGRQTRSFCYVDDLVRGLISLAESDVAEPVNLGSDDERTMLDLARLVIDVVGRDVHICFEPLPQDDPQVRRPCLKRARALLGYQPEVSLEDGLAATARFFGRELQGLRKAG